jgi:hypothetical protein
MADTVSTKVIQDGDQIAMLHFVNLSDGTGESRVLKVDVSELEPHSSLKKSCTSVAINRMWYTTFGMSVDILWEANPDDVAWVVNGDGYLDFRCAPLTNPMSLGRTGDVRFTTVGHSAGDRYSILMEVRKNYGEIPQSED